MEIAFPVPEEKEYELSNLNKGNQYQLYMRAVSRRGTSDPSDVLTVRTECKSFSDYVYYVNVVFLGLLLKQQGDQMRGARKEKWMEKGMDVVFFLILIVRLEEEVQAGKKEKG